MMIGVGNQCAPSVLFLCAKIRSASRCLCPALVKWSNVTEGISAPCRLVPVSFPSLQTVGIPVATLMQASLPRRNTFAPGGGVPV